jgi:hypothetical protein
MVRHFTSFLPGFGSALLGLLLVGSSRTGAAAEAAALPPWQAMDYGPFLTASIEAPEPRTNIAYKGIAINLGANFGGDHNEAIVFDTDLLRYCAGWTGDFVALKGVVFDGEHWAYPRINGRQVFGNASAPGWAHAGIFQDPREHPFGPLPKEWGHWRGLWLHGKKVVLSYSIGGMSVLEMPALERRQDIAAFVRVLNLSADSADNILQVAFDPKRTGQLLDSAELKPIDPQTPAGRCLAVLAESKVVPDLLVAGLVGKVEGARWVASADGNLRLRLPASAQAVNCKVLLWRGTRERLSEFAALVKASPPPVVLREFTRGGPARWDEKLLTRGQRGSDDGPYTIDTLPGPEKNPWHSWMRFGGIDFFPDGRRAALCTWNGDVWIVSGVDGDLQNLTWQRIATGLFQPLGLQIVDGQIYVLGRDQITRLHDLNGDGEADFYENFNNDCMTSEHFHEFALDLKLGPDGNFYYIKCACHGVPATHPHHGTLMRVSRDGSKLEVVARGFRAANGLGVGPHGEFTSIDNQGYWMPGNRINWIKPGGWYGNQWAWNPDRRTTYDEPLCWMHNFVDRSGGTQLWVPGSKWGPFQDQIITISYGMGHIFLLLKEEVNGQMQGAVTRFPLDFETGVMRGVFHPQNGQLYTCGLYGWASNKTRRGGFYRVRYTGKPARMADELHFVRDGIVVGFTDPLDVASATNPGNYDVTAWNYHWTVNYGSPDFKLNGQEGRDSWPVQAVSLSADHRKVFLRVTDVQRVMQLHVVFNLKAADGSEVKNFVHGTIHNLNAKSGLEWLGPGAIVGSAEKKTREFNESPGLVQSFSRMGSYDFQDSCQVRLPALFVAAGTPPTPFTEPGPFRCRWEAFLKLDLNSDRIFELEGFGSANLSINGQPVLEAAQGNLAGRRSLPVSLRQGLNRFELEYESPPAGNAEFRLIWSAPSLPREPVPATVFVCDPDQKLLQEQQFVRRGRELLADFRCAQCHKPESPWPSTAMPELAARAPSLNGVGGRLNQEWVAHWLLDPKAIRPDATMPRILTGKDAAGQAADIAAYLATLKAGPDHPPSSLQPGAVNTNLVASGGKLFNDLGCLGCHRLPGELTMTNDLRVSLAHVAAKWRSDTLPEFLAAPARHFPWTRMPDFKLSADEAAALAAFVLDRADSGSLPATGKASEPALPGDPGRGAKLVATLGCLGCHVIDGMTDQSQASTLASLATADWDHGCMAEDTKHQGRSPDLGWTGQQRAALRAFLRPNLLPSLQRDVPAEFAQRQYTALRCQACHPRDNETDLWTQLAAMMEKPKSANEEDDVTGTRTVHVGRPLLTYAGEKLYAGWMKRFLEGSLPYKPRAELRAKMPAFAAYASGLAEGLAQQHGYPAESAPPRSFDPQLATVGHRLIGTVEGFSCISCHDVGTQKALAGKDTATVNFAYIADRLRPGYYWRYVQDPTRLVPGTMMPRFIGEDGTTSIKGTFDGDPKQQFTAIWNYLLSLQPLPQTH